MDETPIFGIDLGTTNSAIGMVDAGFSYLLADSDGRRIQASVVAYGEDGELSSVGEAAKRERSIHPHRVVGSVKRWMGRRFQEVAETDERLRSGERGEALIEICGRLLSPEEVSAEILTHLKSIAEARVEHPVERVVITVPAYFNEAQRLATKRAGELAGLKVERIINEPTAAALAYGLDRLEGQAKIAVFDLGGGTFDLTILEMQEGVFEVLSTFGDTQLGGDDVDQALANAVLAEHGLSWEELDFIEQQRLLEAVETAKCEIGDEGEFALNLPFFREGLNLQLACDAEGVKGILSPLLERIRRHCLQALSDSNLDLNQLDEVILVGGSTRLGAVRDLVAELFQCEPNLSQHPDEAVALGASIQGAILSGAVRDIVLLDVTPLSLGIETFGGLMNVLIPRNTTIPCKAGEMFTNAVDGQAAMQVRVLQGEREMARDNWQLGELEVEFEPLPKGQARVGVQFAIDANGLLEVLARDTTTGKDTVIEINSAAIDVDDDQVEQMVSESVEHAFTDMNERVFTEAKMKAEELLPAVEEAMQQLAEHLTDQDRAAIEVSVGKVREAMAQQSAGQLKLAVKELDQATESMAAQLVEKAMEEALNRQLGL